MKLSDYSDHIRLLIDKAFRNRLGRMGITTAQLIPIDNIPSEYVDDRQRIETVREVFISETGTVEKAYEKLVEELTFTLFNRLAALKVMEAHTLFPEIITQRETHGGRSFAHLAWLEQNPDQRAEEAEGLVAFMENQFTNLATEIPLFSTTHPYHLLPTAIELSGIITAFNQVETDAQVINSITNEQLGITPNSEFLIPNSKNIWKSDDVLGWLYESYNNQKKADHKASKDKTEYNKVSIQSQVYTPRWVVKFLVDNSLGKLYLEMFPESDIKNKYKIANADSIRNYELGITDKPLIPNSSLSINKKLHQIKLIDPATGSGNFLLYAFDLFYDLYLDQIENYGADYDENEIAKLIIENNLHGVDLDDRAIQLAQLGLYIKAKRRKRTIRIDHFNVVSSDFYLPPYEEVQDIFESNTGMDDKQKTIIRDIWTDLQQAYKFGSLIRLEEKLSIQLHGFSSNNVTLFSTQEVDNYEQFRKSFFINLQSAVVQNTFEQNQKFLNTKTQDAITFLQLLSQKYDIVLANPPYLESDQFGTDLRFFIKNNFEINDKFGADLYSVFIKRNFELANENGYISMVQPNTFMHLVSFKDLRKFILSNSKIEIFINCEFSLFQSVLVNVALNIYNKQKREENSIFISLDKNTFETTGIDNIVNGAINNIDSDQIFYINQNIFKNIENSPFTYWIKSPKIIEIFQVNSTISDYFNFCNGIQTGGNNERFFRTFWEINKSDISLNYDIDKSKWVLLNKGGKYQKWYGNLWLVCEWSDYGKNLKILRKTNKKIRVTSEEYYFNEGLSFTGATSKGLSVRYQPENCIFEIAGKSIFPKKTESNLQYCLGFLNSKLVSYFLYCINPTVNFQTGDLEKIPYIIPNKAIEDRVTFLSIQNTSIIKQLCSFRITEMNFVANPLISFKEASLQERIKSYFNHYNAKISLVLINDAILNLLIYNIYDLSKDDKIQVEIKQGKSLGEFTVGQNELSEFKLMIESDINISVEYRDILFDYFDSLRVVDEIDPQLKKTIIDEFVNLYQSNNDLEDFCIGRQVNPINVWCWFKESTVFPQGRTQEITLEFLTDSIRTLLIKDEDGIIPLVGLPGEPRLLDRLEKYCLDIGLTSAQFMQLDNLVGRSINEFIEQFFFKQLGDLLNIFPNVPKTPFIWHLSSGANQGFEAYIIIYKWNRDSLFKIKSQYLRDRVESLDYRLINLQGLETAAAQNEKETIRLQLREIEHFTKKIDELIAEGYNPILDDGVGKNIAPLQKKGMLKAEVLKANQLVKYLNADW